MPQHLRVLISSTARDLPEHRKEVMDACLRQGMFPIMMEHLPASDAEAISASVRMVDAADIYLLILAHRYGYVPAENNEQQVSITEMEYNRAVDRDIRRAVFIVDTTQPLSDFTIDDIDTGGTAMKLRAFRDRCEKENIVNFFRSADDLRAHVINSLSHYRERDLETLTYVTHITPPPEAHIAHPYTLLQTHQLIGRQGELKMLTDWVADPNSEVYGCPILNCVSIGGMGKSALAWRWFNEIAPEQMKPLAGRMWWSFYESDATFENFVTHALAYVSKRSLDDIQKNIKPTEREQQLFAILDRAPFVLVLDGLERILLAYARMDANRVADDELDETTANRVVNALGLPESAAESFVGKHQLRKTTDPRAGNFLRRLARVHAARILVTTRLYPADLQTVAGDPITGSFPYFLRGLAETDALSLWREFGVTGSSDDLLRLFKTFENHPLLIQALAREIAQYRRAPGDFDDWREHNPEFEPFSLPLVQVKSHVLSFALRNLGATTGKALHVIALFRMPVPYETLVAVLVGKGRVFRDENGLDAALSELEDRGMLGWDRNANQYDLHPLVRGVLWSGMNQNDLKRIHAPLREHFESIAPPDVEQINRIEDLRPTIELYNLLIISGRYDDAGRLFYDRLEIPMRYRLNAHRQAVELLELLFPDGLNENPHLRFSLDQANILNALAVSCSSSGEPRRAVPFIWRQIAIHQSIGHQGNVGAGLRNLAEASRLTGELKVSDIAAHEALSISRRGMDRLLVGISLLRIGVSMSIRGRTGPAKEHLEGALIEFRGEDQWKGLALASLAELAIWMGEPMEARTLADSALELCQKPDVYEPGFIRAIRLHGMADLWLHDFARAEESIHNALTRARATNLLEEELASLVASVALRHRQGDLIAASELLDDVWEAAERGPYLLFLTDAWNLLAEIQRDAGNPVAAIKAASNAFCVSWCNGPPFAYHWGLEAAKRLLKELSAPEPVMPPFDENKFESILAVKFDSTDQFDADKITIYPWESYQRHS